MRSDRLEPPRRSSVSLLMKMITFGTTPRPMRSIRSRIHRRAWVAAAFFALAACEDATGPLPAEGAPEEMRFSLSGYGSGTTIVELDDEGVAVTRIPWDATPGVPILPVHVVPSAQDWAEFWEAAERAGVRRWRGEYVAEGVVDGSGWGLRIVADGTVIESHGNNAWPDRQGREHEMEIPDDFSAFVDAAGTLAGQDDQRPGFARWTTDNYPSIIRSRNRCLYATNTSIIVPRDAHRMVLETHVLRQGFTNHL
jgi:hypothetical protein